MWSAAIGVVVAIIAFVPTFILGVTEDAKYEWFDDVIESKGIWAMTGYHIVVAIIFSSISSGIVCYFGAVIGGSGLPQLISYLKCGFIVTKYKGLLAARNVFLKIVAMTCTVIAGLSVGREGPAIVIGASAALHIGRGVRHIVEYIIAKHSWMHDCMNQLNAGDFRKPFSGEYEHEILLIGAASGFACAFNAPLGGMMFVYEEVAAHWTQHSELGGRVFFGVGVAIGFQKLFYHLVSNDFEQKYEGIVVFDFQNTSIDQSWEYADLPFFIMCAIFSGIFTGFLQKFCLFCHKAHREFFPTMTQRFFVAVSIAVMTAFLFSVVPAVGGVCHVMPTEEEISNSSGTRRFVRYGSCPEGYYNEMATLTLGSGEDMIKHAFSRDAYTFDNGVLWAFLAIYTFTFVVNTGSFMPAGNFVPNVIMGGIMGRIFGNIADHWYGGIANAAGISFSSPGVYAVVGATCQLSCWTRTMPAIMVVMFEATSDTSLTTPMLLMSTLARSIATCFGVDGWAHMLCHAEWVGLPHHAVHPSKWIDMALMDPKDLSGENFHHDGHDHEEVNTVGKHDPKPQSPEFHVDKEFHGENPIHEAGKTNTNAANAAGKDSGLHPM